MASELTPAFPSSGDVPVRRVLERPLLFGRHGTLVGVLSAPTQGARAVPVLLLAGGIIHRVGPSRSLVRIARALAAAGHPCLRFDLSGVGDSARAPESSLQAAAVADIRDAIGTLLTQAASLAGGDAPPDRVALVGFCSGADNALHVAADDARVDGLVLFDPTVHRTSGFRRRELTRRLHSHEAFVNLVSGRSLMKRLESLRERSAPVFPPEYYGLLVSGPEDTDARVARLSARGARRLWVLSREVQGYCNAPEQVMEALPRGWRETLDTVVWATELDHVLSTRAQVDRFVTVALAWLERGERREAA
jgi:pimeloyl-ACP methyl ester carboxylesterase